jgi:hypothetical protein
VTLVAHVIHLGPVWTKTAHAYHLAQRNARRASWEKRGQTLHGDFWGFVPMSPFLFCGAPAQGILTSPRPQLAADSRAASQGAPRWRCSSSSMGRRQVLQVLAAALLARATPAEALNKKRILAKAGPEMTMDNGIRYRDITIGRGYTPRPGDTVAIHYSLFYKDLEVESSRESQGLAALPLGFTFGSATGPGSVLKVSCTKCQAI